jgi:hypothetical protein
MCRREIGLMVSYPFVENRDGYHCLLFYSTFPSIVVLALLVPVEFSDSLSDV